MLVSTLFVHVHTYNFIYTYIHAYVHICDEIITILKVVQSALFCSVTMLIEIPCGVAIPKRMLGLQNIFVMEVKHALCMYGIADIT